MYHLTVGSVLGALQRAPEAGTETISDLVHFAQAGRLRVPEFQRPLRWGERDVVALFDSVYRGLPVGSLLFWKRPAEADVVVIGPLRFNSERHSDAWWVVDGQQRLTSLAVALGRALPLPVKPSVADPFVVYFDAPEAEFRTPPRRGLVPVGWVPLPVMLDATRLSEWVHEWPLGTDRELRRRVFEAGTRIRDYRLPRYLVDAPDNKAGHALLRELFFRVNNTGKPLNWNEVYDALYGHAEGTPSTTSELSKDLAGLGMGRLEGGLVTTCLIAFRGLDVTRPLAEHRRKDPDVLRGAVAEALPALRQTLTFLKIRAAIPHLRLLPRTMILEVLVRFFAVHPEPSNRATDLLVRWVWRVILGEHRIDERTLERRAVAAVSKDEELSIQAMLSLLPKTSTKAPHIPESFDARSAESRVAMLALASLQPRHLLDASPVDLAVLIEAAHANAFGQIIRAAKSAPESTRAPENRILHPGSGAFRRAVLERIATYGVSDTVLRSHAISADAASALLSGDDAGFLKFRRNEIQRILISLGERLAGWERGDNDRPSIDYLLKQAGTA